MNPLASTALDIEALISGDWQQFSKLLLFAYPKKHFNNKKSELNTPELISLLSNTPADTNNTLVNYIDQQLSEKKLTQIDYAIVHFVDQVFKNYLSNCKLHETIEQSLSPLRVNAAQLILNRQLPWLDNSSLRPALAIIYQIAIGWQPELGRAADRFLDQLTPILLSLVQKTDDHSLQTLKDFSNKQQQHINKVEQRLYDSEIGALKARHASQLSAKTLNKFMMGKKLPRDITLFLQGPWRESLRLTLLNKGESSSDWQHMIRLSETLVWSFQPFDRSSEEYCKHVYDSISELSELLQSQTVSLQDSVQLESELAQVEHQHLKILKGEPLEYTSFDLIESSDPLISTQLSISNNLIHQVNGFDNGQWFVIKQKYQLQRVKLSAKIPKLQQLIFTNFLGIKSHQYSFEEFAYLLSGGNATPIKQLDPFQATVEKILRTHADRWQQQTSTDTIKQHPEQSLAVEKKSAREKALREARTHLERYKKSQENAKQQRTSKQIQKLRDDNARHEKEAYNNVSQLSVGGMILFYNENRDSEHCKLAAIIQATNEYIFINRQGIKKYSLSPQQLTERLLNGSAKIIELNNNFDNTLQQVVNTIRTRKDYE